MPPESTQCSCCARDRHTWNAKSTATTYELPSGPLRLIRRACACCRCPCDTAEVTLTAAARARPAHVLPSERDDVPTEIRPPAGHVPPEETTAMTHPPTNPRFTLPPIARLPADLNPYVPRPDALAPEVETLAQLRTRLRGFAHPDPELMR